MAKRGNPNWGSGKCPSIGPPMLTAFERAVQSFNLRPGEYVRSTKLKQWARKNLNKVYVPEALLNAWNLRVDEATAHATDKSQGAGASVTQAREKSTALAKLDQMRQTLSVIRTVDDAKQLRDQAEAMRIYALKQKYSVEMLNYCTEIKIRAERAAGKMLREKVKAGKPNSRGTPRIKLEDLGISFDQSSEWQKIAGMPDDYFETWIQKAKGMGEKITMAGLKETIKQSRQAESIGAHETVSGVEAGLDTDDLHIW